MNLDELGREWRVTNEVAATREQRDRLIAATCRRVERFWGRILSRDLIEAGAAIFVMIFFGRSVFRADHAVAGLGAGLLALWAPFVIWKLYRARTAQPPAPLDAPVHEFCRIELVRLDRQIELLRSVLWWYLAPCLIGANMVFVGSGASRDESVAYGLFTLLLAWGLYVLNRRAVAKQLVPHRNEIASLISQLEDGSADISRPNGPPGECAPTRGQTMMAVFLILVLAALGVVGEHFVSKTPNFPKRAPFSGVRWEGNEPVVRIDEEWSILVSLDGIAADDIVSFCRRTYWLRWQQRFEEDLVEVLTKMGHAPGETVRLVVRPLGSAEPRILEDVPMTEANRQTIYSKASRDRKKRS